MNIWLLSREYAGIAEAGGVKNVARSLSESLAKKGHRVTLFIPLYACTDLESIKDFECVWHEPVFITQGQKNITVTFCHGTLCGVSIVFISQKQFAEKKAVYVYTQEEEKLNPQNRRGTGHRDALELNVIFQKAVVAFGDTCAQEDAPRIIHCQDATSALVPVYLDLKKKASPLSGQFYRDTKCVVTIHNAGPGYHHSFNSLEEATSLTGIPQTVLSRGMVGSSVEPFLLASDYAVMTTVSPQYADEILSGKADTAGLGQEFSRRGVKITGITNGIDFEQYDPKDKRRSFLPFEFDPESKDLAGKYECRNFLAETYCKKNSSVPQGVQKSGYLDFSLEDKSPVFFSYHGRIVQQKGISVLLETARNFLQRDFPVRFVCIGQGESRFEDELAALSSEYEGKFVFFKGYDRALARLCTASSDFAVFPSFFEPCGLEDFIAQIYGTIPVANATGGLCKISDEETGFLFSPCTSQNLIELLEPLIKIKSAAPDIFLPMIAFASKNTRTQYNWDKVASSYEALFEAIE